MTLEKLLESSADELEKMSLQELEAFCAPFLDVTRPDRPSAVHKGEAKRIHKGEGGNIMSDKQLRFASMSEEKQRELKAILDEEGIEL